MLGTCLCKSDIKLPYQSIHPSILYLYHSLTQSFIPLFNSDWFSPLFSHLLLLLIHSLSTDSFIHLILSFILHLSARKWPETLINQSLSRSHSFIHSHLPSLIPLLILPLFIYLVLHSFTLFTHSMELSGSYLFISSCSFTHTLLYSPSWLSSCLLPSSLIIFTKPFLPILHTVTLPNLPMFYSIPLSCLARNSFPCKTNFWTNTFSIKTSLPQ